MTASASVVDLKPCPFCGPSKLRVDNWASWYVRCTDCGATQMGLTKADAIVEWNTRAVSHPAEQDAREAVARVTALAKALGDPDVDRITMPGQTANSHAADLRTLLALTQAAPDGWRLVPMEPDEAMVEAAHNATPATFLLDCDPRNIYRAMLSASPAPPAQGEGS